MRHPGHPHHVHLTQFRTQGRALARASCIAVAAVAVDAIALRAQATPQAVVQPTSERLPPASQNDTRPSTRAMHRPAEIAIDGRLDDEAWNAADVISDFRQQQPDEGLPPTERTELRITYDASALYIAARMFDSEGPSGVRKLLVRRDQLLHDNASDKIAIVLDPYHDRQTSVWFELNPLGVKGDHLNGDASFDPVWEGAAHVDSLGWTAEFRIPLSQLRFPRDSVQTWGFQAWRTLARRNESTMWAFWRRNEPGGPGYFGTITGLAFSAQPRRLELLPYVVQKTTFALPPANDPFRDKREMRARVGGDIKYSLSSNFTVDATVNPDFGQVEADPAIVNLSPFETTFPEKRPFFVANASAFAFGNVTCFYCGGAAGLNVFYSRRIGRAPQLGGLVQAGNHADIPESATILGAVKLTGRTKRGLSVAVLDAVTNRVEARYVPRSAPNADPSERDVEPTTNYFVGRARQDLRSGDTRVGMIATLADRALSDTAHRSRLRNRAAVVGADLQHYWARRGYSFLAHAAISDVSGDTAAMHRTQRTSAHYFQRPGREVTSDGLFDVSYDPDATTLRGYGVYARVAKESGDWRWETAQNWRSPGFEVNDLAALTRTDFKWMQASVVRSWTKPTPWYRTASVTVGGLQQLNYDGDRTDLQGAVSGDITLPNYVRATATAIKHPPTYDQYRTRGGVIVKSAGYNLVTWSLNGDPRDRVSWSTGGQYGPNLEDTGWFGTANASLVLKPADNLRVSVGPAYLKDIDPRGFVTNVVDATASQFGGVRSVFARLEQRNLSLTTRVNATFTPALTLELFAQPFIASGRYSDLNEYRAPRTTSVLLYGHDAGTIAEVRDTMGRVTRYRIDPDGAGAAAAFDVTNPNFNVRSLNGTAVMRWEYRPGSTMFLVWTQQRSGSAALGTFDVGRDASALFRDRPINVFQLKVSYWLGI